MDKTKSADSYEKLFKEISEHVRYIFPDKRTDKSKSRSQLVTDVKEVIILSSKSEKKTKVLLVYLPYMLIKKNDPKKIIELVNEIQKKRNQLTFILSQRTIINKKGDYKQKIPRSRTFTAVFDNILEELIAPAYIVGRRWVHKMNGSLLTKIFINKKAESFLADKVDIIEKIYANLTNRAISIEFREEMNFSKGITIRAKKITKEKIKRKPIENK